MISFFSLNSFSIPPSIPVKDPSLSSRSKIEQWAAQRKIEKQAGIGVLGHVIRRIGALVSAALLLPVALFAGLYALGRKLQEYYEITYRPNGVLAAIRGMKQREEKDKFETMRTVLNECGFLNTLSASQAADYLTQDLAARLRQPAIGQNKGVRYLLRALARQEAFNPAWIDALKDPAVLGSLSFSGEGTPPPAFLALIQERYPHLQGDLAELDWKSLSDKVNKALILPEKIEQDVQEFNASLTQVLRILKDPRSLSDPASANSKFIAAFRQVLRSPVYRTLKEEASHPAIGLLHGLASAMWNRAPSMDAYRQVGASLLQSMDVQDQGQEGEALAKLLADSHAKMEAMHYSDQGVRRVSYALTHPLQVMGALASEGGAARHIPGLFGLDQYDSHGMLGNNPSLQGITAVRWQQNGVEDEAFVHNCYGGSPTIGDHLIAPEFEAVIQAAENNQLAAPDARRACFPMMVNYTNLQNLDKQHGEGPRSRAIMLLNRKYPLSFRGATFAKDSAFYFMKDPSSVVWTNAREFGDKMLAQLMKSFDPEEKGHGFYFHGSPAAWQPLFEKVIEQATAHFEQLARDNPEAFQALASQDLQGAYQEYVYASLNSVIEMESIKTLKSRGINRPTVMALTACKENIDRGGMENAKYIYTRLSNAHPQRLALIMGAMHSRALSARDRAILKSRMPQILNFMKTTAPHTFKARQQALFAALGYPVASPTFRPYMNG